MKIGAAAIALLLAGCAHAPDRVMVTAASHHAIAAHGERFNPINPGAFVTWEGDADLTAGAFLNSYGKPSVAGFASFDLIEANGFDLSVFAGAAHYPEDGRRFALSLGDIVPMAGVQIRHGNLALTVIPSDCAYTCAIIIGGFTFNID